MIRTARAGVALGMVLVLCASVTRGENWPGFRGPTGCGVSSETNLPTRWSETENVAWKVEVPGSGWSSPAVFGERVFLTTATDGGVSCRVLCYERGTGKLLWNKEVFQQSVKRKESKNSFATPTPVTDGEMVYAVFCDGSIAALDYAGNIAWTNRDIRFYSQHGLGASPRLYRDLLIMPFDPSSEGPNKQVGWKIPWDGAVILALDKKTGKERWRGKRGLSRIAHVTPVVMMHEGQEFLVSGAGDVVQGHDLSTGERIWTLYQQGEGVVPSVIVGDGLIFANSGFEKPTINAIRPGGKGDVTKTHIAWSQTANVPSMSSYVFANGCLFAVKENGMAMCLDGKTGKIHWQQRLGGNYCASPIAAGGKIYFLSEEGVGTVIEAGPVFKEIARNSIGEKCQASYAPSDGQIFIRSEKSLWCIGEGAKR